MELTELFARLKVPEHKLQGRKTIYTNQREITPENVIDVLNKALVIHNYNTIDSVYLYNYYKGVQDVEGKTKLVRPEINNKVCVNLANAIVTFKSSYLLAGPIQYVSTGKDEGVSENVSKLNQFMLAEDKESKDKELADLVHICGVASRIVLPDTMGVVEDGSPVDFYILKPWESFVVYFSGVGHRPMMGAIRQFDENDKEYWSIYTTNFYCEIQKNEFKKAPIAHYLERVPIIEYQNNIARLGAFEVVLDVLNAINSVESNRVDSIQDFVNAYDVFQNCEVDSDTYKDLTSGGQAINVKTVQPGMDAKVYRISSELNQSGTQTEIDNLTEKYLTICGMPNRNGGSSTSDTGQATIYRDGWAEADSRAKDTEVSWKRSEREFLRLVFKICDSSANTEEQLNLKLSDVRPEFTRKNFAGLQSKVQVLCQMLENEKIHPKLAWQISTAVADTEEAYRISEEYYRQNLEKQQAAQELMAEQTDNEPEVETAEQENNDSSNI